MRDAIGALLVSQFLDMRKEQRIAHLPYYTFRNLESLLLHEIDPEVAVAIVKTMDCYAWG